MQERAASSKASQELFELTAALRSRWLESLREVVKTGMVSDPDMWHWVKWLVSSWVDQFWLDIHEEVERSLRASLERPPNAPEEVSFEGEGVQKHWLRWRAFVLHHYLPHNKSIFGKLKDPTYCMMFGLTLIPVHGIRVMFFSVILAMLLLPGPADEYQLINFILLFKGVQFLTSGVVATSLGALKYYYCYAFQRGDVRHCIDAHGPGAFQAMGIGVDYLGSIVLVWIAFYYLHAAKQRRLASLQRSKKGANRSNEQGSLAAYEVAAGGRLLNLLYWDMACFAVSALLLALLTALTCDTSLSSLAWDPHFGAGVFWCSVVYSLLSLPFVLFVIPGVKTILTHISATGYNNHGACVAFALESTEDTSVETSWLDRNLARALRAATRVVRLLERGREARGGEVPGQYEGWDMIRGAFRWRRSAGNLPQEAEAAQSAEPRENIFQGISALGRDARGTAEEEEQEGEPITFQDFGRGVVWKLREWWVKPNSHAEVHQLYEQLVATSVEMPVDAIEQRHYVTYYSIDVMPCTSIDGGGGNVWRVMRRFGDFRRLEYKLGPRSAAYAEAPFPTKRLLQGSGEVERRRQALEVWLQRVLEDPLAQSIWAQSLNEFLADGGQTRSYAEEAVEQASERGDSGFAVRFFRRDREGSSHAPARVASALEPLLDAEGAAATRSLTSHARQDGV